MMNWATILEKQTSASPLDEDEYMDESSSLIYCKNCHTPRQVSITIQGRNLRPRCICQCQADALKQKQDAENAEKERRRIARLKANGLQDAALRDYTFVHDSGINPEMQKAHEYVAHWGEMQKTSTGLLLWGDVGTGKSFFAGCIANALLEKGIPVLMTNFARILNALTGMYAADRNEYIDSFNQFSLLILDDLGMERSSEFALEQVFNVIDSRYRSKLPLIVTTNLTMDELKHPADLAHARIYDRVLERCVPLKINNQNIRKLNRDANYHQVKAILSGT